MLDVAYAHRGPLNVLCVGAHADDIEIGCAGTLISLIRAGTVGRVHWVVLSAAGVRDAEAHSAAAAVLSDLRDRAVDIEGFRDGFFPEQYGDIKRYFESLKKRGSCPDLIFTHQLADRHQDHRTVAELTWQTFRDHSILEFEIPKYDGELQTPNVYFPVRSDDAARKWQILSDCYASQSGRSWFRAETFESLARLRGIECNSPTGLAEGFVGRKLRWVPPQAPPPDRQ